MGADRGHLACKQLLLKEVMRRFRKTVMCDPPVSLKRVGDSRGVRNSVLAGNQLWSRMRWACPRMYVLSALADGMSTSETCRSLFPCQCFPAHTSGKESTVAWILVSASNLLHTMLLRLSNNSSRQGRRCDGVPNSLDPL